MMWGFPWSVPWGSHDEMFAEMNVADLGMGPRVRIKVESGLPQYVRLAVDGKAQGNPVYARAGVTTELVGLWQFAGATGHTVSLLPQGDWPGTDLDLQGQIDQWASGRARRISLEISPSLAIFDNGAQLSGWSISGLRRFVNCSPVGARTNWSKLRCVLSDSAGTRTVYIDYGSTTLASGSRVGDGAITLSSVDSGVSGSVSVTYTGDYSGQVYCAWPAAYAIHYTTGTGFTGTDFPRTPDATVYDDGQSNTHYYHTSVLPAATWYIVVHQVDEAGNESTGLTGGGSTAVTYGPPARNTGLAYVTGDATNTQVTFSGGSGATGFLLYDSHSGVMDLNAPTSTLSNSGATVLTGIAAAYSGYRYIIVRSLVGGIDDGNSNQLRIEYSGGAVVLPRPPAPGVSPTVGIDGRTMTIPVSVSLAEYDAMPAYIEIYLWDVATGSFISGSPAVTGTIATGTMLIGTEIVTTVAVTAPDDGQYYFLARSVTSGGIASSNTDYVGPVRLTTAQPAQPASITAKSA
jgi:hypothetical protein